MITIDQIKTAQTAEELARLLSDAVAAEQDNLPEIITATGLRIQDIKADALWLSWENSVFGANA